MLLPWKTFSKIHTRKHHSSQYLQVTWHPVSRDVGNVRNKRDDLHTKVDISEDDGGGKNLSKADKKSRSLMENWLKKGAEGPSPKRGRPDEEDERKN